MTSTPAAATDLIQIRAVDEHTAELILNRPDALNAISTALA